MTDDRPHDVSGGTMERTGQQKGFTLVELIVVIAIISLFVLVAIPTVMSYRARRGRDIGDAALILRSTLRTARTYAIQNRVRAGVLFSRDGSRYQIWYFDKAINDWKEPEGTLGKEHLLPANMTLLLDSTVVLVPPGFRAHIFDPAGTLDTPSALKATILLSDDSEEVPPLEIEILRATGRVRMR